MLGEQLDQRVFAGGQGHGVARLRHHARGCIHDHIADGDGRDRVARRPPYESAQAGL